MDYKESVLDSVVLPVSLIEERTSFPWGRSQRDTPELKRHRLAAKIIARPNLPQKDEHEFEPFLDLSSLENGERFHITVPVPAGLFRSKSCSRVVSRPALGQLGEHFYVGGDGSKRTKIAAIHQNLEGRV